MPQRHIPERTCVACRSLRPKREMVRVVRTTDGPVEVDPTGKRSGRGAYLCRLPECWQAGLRRKALDRALKIELSAADREALASFATEQFAMGDGTGADPAPSEQPTVHTI
jgi:predicted RNA-binding protein YlxR (DUF448 family)